MVVAICCAVGWAVGRLGGRLGGAPANRLQPGSRLRGAGGALKCVGCLRPFLTFYQLDRLVVQIFIA